MPQVAQNHWPLHLAGTQHLRQGLWRKNAGVSIKTRRMANQTPPPTLQKEGPRVPLAWRVQKRVLAFLWLSTHLRVSAGGLGHAKSVVHSNEQWATAPSRTKACSSLGTLVSEPLHKCAQPPWFITLDVNRQGKGEIKVACLVGRLATNHSPIALEASEDTPPWSPIMTRTIGPLAILEMTEATQTPVHRIIRAPGVNI